VRFTESPDALSDAATNLVRENVDVIIAVAVPAALVAKRATLSIPIVMVAGGDPVQYGLVANLARPGSNVTGTAALSPDLIGKQLELLKEILPRLNRVAVIWNTANLAHQLQWNEINEASRTLRIQMESIEVRRPQDFEDAYTRIAASRVDAIQLLPDSLIFGSLTTIAEFSLTHRVPSIFFYGDYPETGGLLSYGPKLADLIRTSMSYVDKILKGARPADLPVQQPVSFELVVNRKTEKALGLKIPQSVLLRADRVIE
jgi:putative ABC transport system substrate-binding protein